MSSLTDNILLKVCSKILDPVTTTDELIPSGETSSYRSNPLGLAEFTLSRRDPDYVGRAKAVAELERERLAAGEGAAAAGACEAASGACEGIDLGTGEGTPVGIGEGSPVGADCATVGAGEGVSAVDGGAAVAVPSVPAEVAPVFDVLAAAGALAGVDPAAVEIGSTIYAVKPGDGSAREQAASCQRVLGGLANITREYATKRYRSNVMNWGMVPFQMEGEPSFEVGDYVFVPGIRTALDGDMADIPAWVVRASALGSDTAPAFQVERISLFVADMTPEERAIVKAGCLINYNRARAK